MAAANKAYKAHFGYASFAFYTSTLSVTSK